MEWLDSVAGPGYTAALLWTVAALILLVIVLVIIKLFRSLTFGTFVSGGRNRKTRLAVMDAAAVDSHRRLVLVRRDDVEHLLLIGGPTDVVVEQDIRLNQRRPSLAGENNHEPPARPRALEPQPQPAPRPAPQPRTPEPAPRPMSAAQPIPAVAPQQPAPMAAPRPTPAPAPRPEPRMPAAPVAPAPVRQEPVISAAPVQQAPAPAVSAPQRDDVDDSLLRELEISLEETPAQPEPSAPEVSLDDEMTKLLGELSSQKR
jgi:outer membrane biosynthesis protein TonB